MNPLFFFDDSGLEGVKSLKHLRFFKQILKTKGSSKAHPTLQKALPRARLDIIEKILRRKGDGGWGLLSETGTP